MQGWGNLVGSLQASAARSRTLSRLAVKLKGQCDSIIGRRLSSGIKLETNGEGWLADRIAPTSRLFVDVGANVGDWSLYFARQMPEPNGLLFEPAPITAKRLTEAVAASRLEGLAVITAAVSDSPGAAKFSAEPECGETSSLVLGHSQKDATTVDVTVVTLDQVLAERGIATVDMLKIDAEGFDLRVLNGARDYLSRRRIKVIQFEYNSPWAAAGSTLASAYGLLEGYGYTVRVLRGDGLWKFDPTSVGEFYRYANFVAWVPDASCFGLEEATNGVLL